MSIQLNKDAEHKKDSSDTCSVGYCGLDVGLDELMVFFIVTLVLLALHIGAYIVVERSADEAVVQSQNTSEAVVQSTDTVETAINAVDVFGYDAIINGVYNSEIPTKVLNNMGTYDIVIDHDRKQVHITSKSLRNYIRGDNE